MIRSHRLAAVAISVIGIGLAGKAAPTNPPSPGAEIAGLWSARRDFGPRVGGTLFIAREAPGGRAEVAGRTASVRFTGDRVSFALADGEGDFRGLVRKGRIVGHWIQPPTASHRYGWATPVLLEPDGPDRWRGMVEPLEDRNTIYMPVRRNEDGTMGAFLRNPERNLGRFLGVEQIEIDGRSVKLLGRRSDQAPRTTVAEGIFDAETQRISIYLPWRGGTYDFQRASAADKAAFYPRGQPPEPYAYRPPPKTGDGWGVGSLEEAGVSREAIERFVQMLLNVPMDSIHASDVHAVLIARHGKLVLEEYFHGFHRDEPHDTRSASKSATSVLAGAAIHRGLPIATTTIVDDALRGAAAVPDSDPRRRAMTVETLLTMSPGLDCDDADPQSPGQEDTMQEQTEEPDWYRFMLNLRLVRRPGEKAVYCSGVSNLIGGVLGRATGRWLPELYHELLATPLQLGRYALNLTPTGDAYMGGGTHLLPRDFLKLGQLMMDGGRWKDRRIIGEDWARRSVSPLYALRANHYGYQWWVTEYPYRGRKVRAFFAGGNGGQVVMGVPELDLVIGFHGGNYSDQALFIPQRIYVPEHILPAVAERPGRKPAAAR
ncbi:MAG: serine hydrolase [Thermoanaerobaculia bacterium]|nr:serine hydrolase [Thermoanaerobaculia bacterium]